MIRVTPIGGEPVELPEETECIGHHDRHGEVIEVLDVDSSDGEDGDTTARVRFPKSAYPGQVEFRLVSTLTRATLSRPYFVHVGDTWPLCEIETWRARAERLERELEALKTLPQMHVLGKEAAAPYMKAFAVRQMTAHAKTTDESAAECRTASLDVPGRAVTPNQKRAAIERIYAAWLKAPEQRLGQLLGNACRGGMRPTLFYREDEPLADAVEQMVTAAASDP